MIEEPKNVRMPLMVSKSEASDIDDFRFNRKFFSRAQAVRHLMHCGIELPSLCENLIRAIDKLERSGTPIPENVRAAQAKLAPYLSLNSLASSPTTGFSSVPTPEPNLAETLSIRELAVLNAIGTGKYHELAEALGITVGTFKAHVVNAKRKLGVSSTTEAKRLVAMYQRHLHAVGINPASI